MTNDAMKAHLLKLFDLSRWQNPCAVTLTMKKRSLNCVNDPITASTNYRHFANRLNATVLGSKAKRHGGKLQTIAVIESNADGRLHYHAVIDRPSHWTFKNFAEEIAHQWRRTNFGYDEVDVQDGATAGWTTYMLKYRQKASLPDSIDWENCHLTAE